LIVLRDEGGPGVESLNWLGEFSLYAGWSEWVSRGVGLPAKVAILSAVRHTWPKTDAQSQEQATPWTSKGSLDRIVPNDLKALAPERLATLTRVATPSPFLFEKSNEILPRPVVPSLAARLTETPADFPPLGINPPPLGPGAISSAPPPLVPAALPASPSVIAPGPFAAL
jgi:eukaryotic-like serine/threonine-protein kinase